MRLSAILLLVAVTRLESTPAPDPLSGMSAVLGALALGGGFLLGAKVYEKYGYDYYDDDCYSCGCGGCGGHCGWCGGHYGGDGYGCHGDCGGYVHRRRREAALETFSQAPEAEALYDALAAEDKDGCGLKLVCQLAQKDPRDLDDMEFQILLPYRGLGQSDGTTFGKYDEAAWHGQNGDNCLKLYTSCKLSSEEMMTIKLYTSCKLSSEEMMTILNFSNSTDVSV